MKAPQPNPRKTFSPIAYAHASRDTSRVEDPNGPMG